MHPLDLATRKFWRATGRSVDLQGADSWLSAPISTGSTVGDTWLATEAARLDGQLAAEDPASGLLASMSALDGPGFSANDLDHRIRDFYEHTARWRMEAWTSWSPVFWPGGELGNVQVFLRPHAEDGALVLASPRAPFGGDGAYVVVEDRGRTFAARIPVDESFRVYADSSGVLRTDHVLQLWNTTAVRLHYKLELAG